MERKNGTVKSLLRKLDRDISKATAETLVRRAVFMSNMFSGSKVRSLFQLGWGYQPSIVVIPPSMVSEDLFQAHVEQAAIRALQKVRSSHTTFISTSNVFKEGEDVRVWHQSPKCNEANEWVRGKVIASHPHLLEVRRMQDGKAVCSAPMRPAYEDVRLAPSSLLTKELME